MEQYIVPVKKDGVVGIEESVGRLVGRLTGGVRATSA